MVCIREAFYIRTNLAFSFLFDWRFEKRMGLVETAGLAHNTLRQTHYSAFQNPYHFKCSIHVRGRYAESRRLDIHETPSRSRLEKLAARPGCLVREVYDREMLGNVIHGVHAP